MIHGPLPVRRLAAALFAGLFAAGPAVAGGAPLYHLVRLTVPDGTDVFAADINDAGQVVGSCLDAGFNQVPVWWDADGAAHRLAVPGLGDAQAVAINNAGQIVGTFLDYENPVAGVLWNAAAPGYTLLDDSGTINVSPLDINDEGVVVGGAGAPAAQRAFVWTAGGGLVDYGVADPTVEFQQARWTAVNASGKLVGHFNVHSSDIHAIVGSAGTASVLAMGGASEDFPTVATAVNAAGTVVGAGLAEDAPVLVPVVFGEDGSYSGIPGATLDQGNGCARAINDAGIIGGAAGIGSASGCVPGLKAWVYRDGTVHDLADVVDDLDGFASLSQVRAINADGVLLGQGRLADDSVAAFIAVPIRAEAIFADGFDG